LQITFTILLTLLHFGGVHFRKSPEGVKDNATVTSVSSFVIARLFVIRSLPSMGHRIMLIIFLLTCLSVNVNAQTSLTFNAAGTHSFTPPAGVTNVTVECWGGGGCSGNNTGHLARGGGGGGSYTGGSITVVPGVPINVIVGAGGIYNDNNTTTDNGGQSSVGQIVAKGGSRGIIDNNVSANGGAGGTVSTNPGGVAAFISFPGGNGGNGYVGGNKGGGGGGGESASASGAGNPGGNGAKGAGGAGGNGNAGGGDGGRGSNNDGSPNSIDGNNPGGGGGGRGDEKGDNTNGGNGQIIISWTIPAGYCAGNAITVLSHSNVVNWDQALGVPDGIGVHLNKTDDQLALELTTGNPLTAGGSVNVTWQRVSRDNSLISVEISENGSAWTFVDDYTNNQPQNTWTTLSIPLSINTKYIRFTSENGKDLDIDAISYFTPCGPVCVPPTAFTVTGSGNYCTGGAGLPVTLSGSETGVEYQLLIGIAPIGTLVTGTGAAINFGNQTTAGTYTVVATRLADACPAQMNGDATITISTIPSTPSPITGFTSPCIGTAQTYSVTNMAGITYNWTYPADWTQSSGGTTNSITVIPGASSGNIEVTPSNACGAGTSQVLAVTPNATVAIQPGVITGAAQQCQNTAGQVYSISAVAGATSYSWTVPVGWTLTSGQGTTSIIAKTGLAGQNGNITVTADYSCGSSTASTFAVTVNPSNPVTPVTISGPALVCEGITGQVYSIAAVSDATNYTWAVPAGWTITNGQGTTSITVNPGLAGQNGNVSVTAGNFCGTSAAKTLAVTVEAPPATPGAITGNLTQCAGLTGQNYSISAVPNATSYTWTVPAGWSVTSGAGTTAIKVNTGSSGQNGTVSVTASNTCGTSAARTLTVSVLTASISANYCFGGGSIQLTANGGSAGDTYLWSTSETSKQILVNVAGQYSVTIKNSAGCTATANYSIATELVVNGDFSAGNTGFTHSTYIYEPDIAGNAELGPEGHYGVGSNPQTYHSNFWGRDHTTNTGNFMIINGFPGTPQPVVWATTVAVVPGVAYYFSAWALSLNSVGNYATLQFRVNNTLVGTTAPLLARPNNNNSPYKWEQFYGTWTAPAGVFSVPIEIVDYQTAASGNDFGLDDISFATLAPMPAKIAPASNASTFCAGQALNLYANLTGGKAPFTYSWTGPDGFTSNIANPTIPSVTVANTGVYNLTITDGYGCPAVTASTNPVTVNPSPTCSITGPATLCPSSTGNIYTAPAGAAVYAWSITGNGTIQGLTNGESVTVTAGGANNSSFTLSLALTGSNGCTSNCQQVISVEDNVAPTFVLPLHAAEYCVEYVSQALYNPGQENTPLDITYLRPDYYLISSGSLMLNLSSVADNCALSVNPVSWTIDFGNNGSIEFSGAGQISTYGLEIQFPLGTNRISYTVTDLVGNVRVQFVDLIVTPRPVISNNF